MSRRFMVLCGVPEGECVGALFTTDQQLGTTKGHGSHEEAFKCRVRYLLKQGYTRIGTRDFRPPDGGPVLILGKKSRYGGRLRLGKFGTRFMPDSVHGIRGMLIEAGR